LQDNPQLLALDVDGTLLRRDGVIDPRDRAAIAAAQAHGVAITLLTGRLYSGTRWVARELGIRGAIACVDGAVLVDAGTDQLLWQSVVEGADAQLLHAALAGRELAAYPLFGDRVYYDRLGEAFARYARNWSWVMEKVPRVLEHPLWGQPPGLSALIAVGPEEEVLGAAALLRAARRFEVADFTVRNAPGAPDQGEPAPHGMLVHAAGVSKGAALAELADRRGVPLERVAAVGDWQNDVSMFQAAGRSFVMGHAPEEVKRAATDRLRADGHSGGGVAEAIACMWPGR